MKIHVSDPCKMLLDDRYVLEERSEGQELMDKVIITAFDFEFFLSSFTFQNWDHWVNFQCFYLKY